MSLISSRPWTRALNAPKGTRALPGLGSFGWKPLKSVAMCCAKFPDAFRCFRDPLQNTSRNNYISSLFVVSKSAYVTHKYTLYACTYFHVCIYIYTYTCFWCWFIDSQLSKCFTPALQAHALHRPPRHCLRKVEEVELEDDLGMGDMEDPVALSPKPRSVVGSFGILHMCNGPCKEWSWNAQTL